MISPFLQTPIHEPSFGPLLAQKKVRELEAFMKEVTHDRVNKRVSSNLFRKLTILWNTMIEVYLSSTIELRTKVHFL